MDLAAILRTLVFLAVAACLTAGGVFAQSAESAPKKINFDYSQNPKAKTAPRETTSEDKPDVPADDPTEFDGPSLASNTLEAAKKAVRKAVSPTDIYRVGVGDVLFISLQDAPAGASMYFTVLTDGSIDYPIAGGAVRVVGMTTDTIEEILLEKIKLIENPRLTVRVRDHSSHVITVLGLVERPGEKQLQREAVPLFVVRAEAIVKPEANRVSVRRSNREIETFELSDPGSENILIFPGDIIDFSHRDDNAAGASVPQFFYIGGDVKSVGQKDFYAGLTLTQAILASGGLSKSRVKSVIVRRKTTPDCSSRSNLT